MLYRLMYALRFTPWDHMFPVELADMITGPNALPAGRALDMGSGNGTKAIYMATHGWRVTAIEAVPRAMAEARRRAAKVGVKVDFRQADMTSLEELKLEPGYTLIFDFGCYHGLNRKQRDAYVRGVKAVAAQGATLLLMGFSKAVPPIPLGVTEIDLADRFGPEWKLQWSHPHGAEGTSAMNRGAAKWFCLTCTG